MHSLKQQSPNSLKRRSSEPHHLRNKPSSGTDDNTPWEYSKPPPSRPRTGRRTLFYAVLITFTCSFLQYKLLGHSLPYHIGPAQSGTPGEVVDDRPFLQATFQLEEPSYEVLVLRSVLQHQNDTYRNAVPSKKDREWFVQSLAWLRISHGGIRPDHKSISAVCVSRQDSMSEQSVGVTADVNVVWTDRRDRGIGQDLMLLVECDVSGFLDVADQRNDLKETVTTRIEVPFDSKPSQEVSWSAEADTLRKACVAKRLLDSVALRFSFEHDFGMVETTSSGPMPSLSFFRAPDVPVRFDDPQDHVTMAACLSPAFLAAEEDSPDAEDVRKMPLLRWLEWREHMRRLGVERVNWYSRHRRTGDFVHAYNHLQSTKDVFRYAPPLGMHANLRTNPYHDQDAYLTDCILANRDTSEYIFVLDHDEYPMVNFDDETRSPARQWLDFMQSLPEDRGSWEMTRIPMSSSSAGGGTDISGGELLLQDQFDCVNGVDTKVKSFYDSKTVIAVNQHKKTRMYPIGSDIARNIKAKPDRVFWEHGWNSSLGDAWPKLMHYRWFDDQAQNGCTGPSPLKNSPGYSQYLTQLREDVFDIKVRIEQVLS